MDTLLVEVSDGRLEAIPVFGDRSRDGSHQGLERVTSLFNHGSDAILDIEAHGKLGLKLFLGDNLNMHDSMNYKYINDIMGIYLAGTSSTIVTSLEIMKFGVASANNANALSWISKRSGDILQNRIDKRLCIKYEREQHLIPISEESGYSLRVNAGLSVLHYVGTLVVCAILRHANLEIIIL
jgi:hypothetical protein